MHHKDHLEYMDYLYMEICDEAKSMMADDGGIDIMEVIRHKEMACAYNEQCEAYENMLKMKEYSAKYSSDPMNPRKI